MRKRLVVLFLLLSTVAAAVVTNQQPFKWNNVPAANGSWHPRYLNGWRVVEPINNAQTISFYGGEVNQYPWGSWQRPMRLLDRFAAGNGSYVIGVIIEPGNPAVGDQGVIHPGHGCGMYFGT